MKRAMMGRKRFTLATGPIMSILTHGGHQPNQTIMQESCKLKLLMSHVTDVQMSA